MATTLSGINLYPDSTFEIQSRGSIKAGVLLEIIQESVIEHDDASQNQTFKWYKVKTPKGKQGWVFGDAIAVILPDTQVDAKLKKFHKKQFNFTNGFEKATLWIASMEGRDNFHQQALMNPPYKEYYMVFSNERGNCAFIHFGGENARGHMDLRLFQVLDTTGDKVPELLVQTSTFSTDHDLENRVFEIYSFRTGGLSRIFEERMSLSLSGNKPSPSLFKHVEVDNQIVRIAYIDFLSCENSNLQNDYGDFSKRKEYCMEYVTYTYSWNERTQQYRMIYEESRTTPTVGSRRGILSLKDEPSIIGKQVGTATRSDRIEVIKLHERNVLKNGIKKTVPYLYVKLRNGISGFVEASEVGFIDIEHAALLNEYYKTATPDLSVWKTKKQFLKIVGDNRSSYTGTIGQH